MYEIPKPELLDPDRVERNDRERLHRRGPSLAGAAARQGARRVLRLRRPTLEPGRRAARLPARQPAARTRAPPARTPQRRLPDRPRRRGGLDQWINAFATTTSVLCGAHGDSGFGLSRAREEARLRRTAPELLVHAQHPDLGKPSAAPDAASTVPVPADNPTIVRSAGAGRCRRRGRCARAARSWHSGAATAPELGRTHLNAVLRGGAEHAWRTRRARVASRAAWPARPS